MVFPPLLVLECDLSLTGERSNEKDLVDKHENGPTRCDSSNIASTVKSEKNVDMNRRSTFVKHTTESALPTPPPAPLRLRRIRNTKPPRYRDIIDGVVRPPRAPFWERQKREEQRKLSSGKKVVASIQRRSYLFAFLVTLASFVAVDDYVLLPTGTLFYVVALSMAWENWTNEAEEHLRYLEQVQHYRKRLQTIEKEVEKARFEYHVLRNRPDIDILIAQRQKKRTQNGRKDEDVNREYGVESFDLDDDHWIVYADEKKQYRSQPKHKQHSHEPTRYWRSHTAIPPKSTSS